MDKYNNSFAAFPDDEEELSLLDILIILAEQKKLIAAIALLFIIAGVGYTFYAASDNVPVKYSSNIQMLTQDTYYIWSNGELRTYRPSNMVQAIVRSNAMMDSLSERFALENPTDISRVINVSREGLITVSVTSLSPELSAEAAKFIYAETNNMLASIITPRAADRARGVEFPDELAPLRNGEGSIEVPEIPIAPFLQLHNTSPVDTNGRIGKSQNILLLVSPVSEPTKVLPSTQKRAKTVVLAALLGIFCGVTAAFVRHFWTAPKDQETTEKMNRLRYLLGLKAKD